MAVIITVLGLSSAKRHERASFYKLYLLWQISESTKNRRYVNIHKNTEICKNGVVEKSFVDSAGFSQKSYGIITLSALLWFKKSTHSTASNINIHSYTLTHKCHSAIFYILDLTVNSLLGSLYVYIIYFFLSKRDQ